MTALKMIVEHQSTLQGTENRFEFIKANNPSLLHLDWDGAQEWNRCIESGILVDDLPSICRQAASIFLLNNPLLLELVIRGREILISNLNDDEIQVFRNAGLLEKYPPPEIVQWWDEIKFKGRAKLNQDLLAQGREAERWTLDFEIQKIGNLGRLPIWVALDGDHYGYDILSYRPNGDKSPLSILIEVKSFFSPLKPQFYLTKYEWNKAVETGSNYLFFIWCMTTRKYKVYSHEEIEPHIPSNRGTGTWDTVIITLRDWGR